MLKTCFRKRVLQISFESFFPRWELGKLVQLISWRFLWVRLIPLFWEVLASSVPCGLMKLFSSPVSPHLKVGIVSSFKYGLEETRELGPWRVFNPSSPCLVTYVWLQHFFRKLQFFQNLESWSCLAVLWKCCAQNLGTNLRPAAYAGPWA